MTRTARRALAAPAILLLLGFASPALAAPIQTNGILSVDVGGLGTVSTSGPGSVVDVTGNQVFVPAGLVALSATVTIPVTATTQVQSLVITKLSNLSGTFSLNGVTAQSASEVCPSGGPPAGSACNTGGRIGGKMAITGIVSFQIIPIIVPIFVNLNAMQIGEGGTGLGPFTTEAALWSTGAGIVNTGNGLLTETGSAAGALQLVSPTYLDALGTQLPIFATFTLTNVSLTPEPAAPLLMAAGVIGILLLRRWR